METQPLSVPHKIEKQSGKVSASELANTDLPLSVNGLLYMPNSDFNPETFRTIAEKYHNEPWFEELELESREFKNTVEAIDEEDEIMITSCPGMLNKASMGEERYFIELGRRLVDLYVFFKAKNKDQEPDWFEKLDSETKRILSFQSIWNRPEDFPPKFRFAPMLYAGISSFVIEDISMYEDLDVTFSLLRLNGIRQFRYKQDPAIEQGQFRKRINKFEHQRYRHAFSVLAVANLIGANIGLSKEELKILQIAAVTHDYRTPAGGDTTKAFVDPEVFDEDLHYDEIFETEGWREFADKYGITEEQEKKLYETILGQGILGQILDLADKVTYISEDTDMYLNAPDHRALFGSHMEAYDEADNPGFQSIKSITEEDPLVGSIWESVELIDGKIVIADGERFARILKLRSLMFNELYMSAYSRFFVEVFVGKITKNLWDERILTKEILLNTDDTGLNHALQRFMGFSLFELPDQPTKSSFKSFSNLEEAIRFAKQFDGDPDAIAIVDDIKALPDSATRKFTVKKDGKSVPFNEAYPSEAGEIDGIINSIKKINVYVISFDDLKIPESHREKVKEVFRIG